MERVIITKGHFDSKRRIILEEDIPYQSKSFEIIIRPLADRKIKRKSGSLKGQIHISKDFNESLDAFKEYME